MYCKILYIINVYYRTSSAAYETQVLSDWEMYSKKEINNW